MAGKKSERIGALRWDIVANNSDLVTKIRASNRMTKDLARAMKMTRTPMERYTKGLMDARAALKRGQIDGKAYRYELERLQRQLGKEQLALDQNTRSVNKNTRAKVLNSRASRGNNGRNMANILGSGLSGVGAGGAGAGAGRLLALGAGGGATGAAALGAFASLGVIIKSAKEYAKLESDIVELQVFMGKKKGKEYADQFRNIARQSSLTTTQLVKNAAVIKSYGVELENIVDFTQRLGEASGGDSTQFNNLTKAFAQINALGKLMGQEKNQLVNAGFSLKLIAREAQVPMDEFAKAMENGLITAQHVNDALIKATSEGGLYYGRLADRAETLAGRWDILVNSTNELFAMMGEGKSNWLKTGLGDLTSAVQDLTVTMSMNNQLNADQEKLDEINRRMGVSAPGSSYGGSYRTDGPAAGTRTHARVMDENAANNELGLAFGRWMSGQQGFFEALTSTQLQYENDLKQKQQQTKYKLDQAEAKFKKQFGYDIDDEEEDSVNPDAILDPRETTDGSTGSSKGPGLQGFEANSIGEYNFLRDKLTADRDLAQKSYNALVTIAQNTGGEPGKNGSWRSKAREGLKEKKWRQDQMGGYATDLYGWAMQGFRTDEQVRADQAYNAVGDPTGGSFAADRKRKSAEIYDKYAGEDGLLSSRFAPGDNYERAFNIENSEWGRYTEEVREMTTELKAQYKRKKNEVERKEELKEIKNNVDETRGVKGVLTNIFNHMKTVQENTEAL
jgi:tape measure domain-containing protein